MDLKDIKIHGVLLLRPTYAFMACTSGSGPALPVRSCLFLLWSASVMAAISHGELKARAEWQLPPEQ
jgi:hypothetical protein